MNTHAQRIKKRNPHEDNLEKPCVGTLFGEEENVHTFYTNYVCLSGFNRVRRTSNMGMNRRLKYFMLAFPRVRNGCNTSKNVLYPKP